MMVGRWVSFWDSLFSGAMLNFGGVVCCLNLWPTLEIWDVAGRSALFSWATAEGKNAVYNSGNKAFEHITLLPLLPKQQNYHRNSEMRLNDNLAMSKKKTPTKINIQRIKNFPSSTQCSSNSAQDTSRFHCNNSVNFASKISNSGTVTLPAAA